VGYINDANKDGIMNESDVLLDTNEALPKDSKFRTGSHLASWVAYAAKDTACCAAGFANDTFALCDNSRENNRSDAIVIIMGRARTEAGKAKCQ
jgi:hypothetical protein